MDKKTICCAGGTPAIRYACTYLSEKGLHVVTDPGTDVKYLLLDVPSFGANGQLRMGGDMQALLEQFREDVIVCGGNLRHPALKNYRTVDFLKDEVYLAKNAYITAESALDTALPYLTITLRECPVLIIGWGRIGKCLGSLLKAIGSDVSIAARKETDRAMIHALGYEALDTADLETHLSHFRLIFNTVPAPVLNSTQLSHCGDNCVMIELASKNGMEHKDVIIARGLPGIHMPESSGRLIAETFLRYYEKEETS